MGFCAKRKILPLISMTDGMSLLPVYSESIRVQVFDSGLPDVIKVLPPDLFVDVTEDCPDRSSNDIACHAISGNFLSIHHFSSIPLAIRGIF